MIPFSLLEEKALDLVDRAGFGVTDHANFQSFDTLPDTIMTGCPVAGLVDGERRCMGCKG